MSRRFIVFTIFLGTFFIDRLAKTFVSNALPGEGNFIFNENFISITQIYNTGAAFGLFKGWTLFLVMFSLAVLVSLAVYVFKKHNELDIPQATGIGLILGGTAGNLFDRAAYGHVIDFIKLNFIDFPVFNLADLFINIGVILILVVLVLSKNDPSNNTNKLL